MTIATIALLGLAACGQQPLTLDEAQEGMQESFEAARMEVATYEVIQITTDFTLGGAAEEIAEAQREFIESQIACAIVTLADRTVTIDFGDLEDGCVYNGHTYGGVVAVRFDDPAGDRLAVHHTWSSFTNGDVTLDGAADVTWDLGDVTRHVVHTATWTNELGDVLVGTGDRIESLVDVDAGLEAGIQIDGSRSWTHNDEEWGLAIDGVQMRGQDPVPQAGTYTLTFPDGRELVLTFERIDEDTIRVTLTGTRVPHTIEVSSTDGSAE